MHNENEDNRLNNAQGNFSLPGDYFQKSAQAIVNKIEWTDEHKTYPRLAYLKGGSGFIVPDHYFQANETKLELLLYPNLFSINRQTGFVQPESYLEQSELRELGNVLIANDDELDNFVNLNALTKQNNFKVDEDYFAVNQARLQALLQEEKTARVFNLFGFKLSYAVAALLVVALGFWTYSYYFKTVEAQDCGTMACIDKTDLVNSRNLETMDDDELFELVDPKTLEQQINANKTIKKQAVKTDSSLKDMATEDLLDEL